MNVFDVLREKLEERRTLHSELSRSDKLTDEEKLIQTRFDGCFCKAIEIIDQVEQEYNNGWIPYESENMLNQEVLVDCTIIRLSDNHRWVQNLIYCPYERHKWKWTDYPNDIYVDDKKFKVLAWKPVSEPYGEDIPRKQSNADRIRAMSDEELTKIIMCPYDTAGASIDIMPCVTELGTQKFVSPEFCNQCMMKWLQREVDT